MLYFGLKNFTNHNIYQKVPNLVGVQLSDVTKIMDREGLRFEVIDSARFVPSMNPFQCYLKYQWLTMKLNKTEKYI